MKDPQDRLRAPEGLPLDFAEYLGRRLNVERTDVLPMLGKCLVEYEPRRRYPIVFAAANDRAA